MAEVIVASPTFTVSVNGSNDYVLPGGSGYNKGPWKWVIELANPSGWTGTFTPKARLAGNAQTAQPVPYIGLSVNGTVGTGLPVSTALTTTSLITMDASEMDCIMSCAFTGGTIQLTGRLSQSGT